MPPSYSKPRYRPPRPVHSVGKGYFSNVHKHGDLFGIKMGRFASPVVPKGPDIVPVKPREGGNREDNWWQDLLSFFDIASQPGAPLDKANNILTDIIPGLGNIEKGIMSGSPLQIAAGIGEGALTFLPIATGFRLFRLGIRIPGLRNMVVVGRSVLANIGGRVAKLSARAVSALGRRVGNFIRSVQRGNLVKNVRSSFNGLYSRYKNYLPLDADTRQTFGRYIELKNR